MKGYYSIKETSEELGVSIPTIRVWVRNGTLKASKLNNGLTSKILIPKKEIKSTIAELKKELTAERGYKIRSVLTRYRPFNIRRIKK